jgi:hypothetical protein
MLIDNSDLNEMLSMKKRKEELEKALIHHIDNYHIAYGF